MVGVLIGLLLSAVLLTAGLSTLSTSSEVQNTQDIAIELEQNLRVALDGLSDSLIMAGSGTPTSNLDTWIPWVSDFTENPKITTYPLTISEAHCTSLPILTVASVALAGDTTIAVSAPTDGSGLGDVVNTSDKPLIAIDDETFAHVTDVDVGNMILTIDTDPTVAGDQGLSRNFPVGAPICRVDVSTFEVDPVTDRLGMNLNDGNGPRFFAEQISEMEITTLETGRRYELIVTAVSDRADPATGSRITRALRRVVTLRN